MSNGNPFGEQSGGGRTSTAGWIKDDVRLVSRNAGRGVFESLPSAISVTVAYDEHPTLHVLNSTPFLRPETS